MLLEIEMFKALLSVYVKVKGTEESLP